MENTPYRTTEVYRLEVKMDVEKKYSRKGWNGWHCFWHVSKTATNASFWTKEEIKKIVINLLQELQNAK